MIYLTCVCHIKHTGLKFMPVCMVHAGHLAPAWRPEHRWNQLLGFSFHCSMVCARAPSVHEPLSHVQCETHCSILSLRMLHTRLTRQTRAYTHEERPSMLHAKMSRVWLSERMTSCQNGFSSMRRHPCMDQIRILQSRSVLYPQTSLAAPLKK